MIGKEQGTPAQVTDEEKARYGRFVRRQLGQFKLLRRAPETVWHYTSGEALIGIVESGRLWSTQVSCLNDRTEIQYALMLLRDALRERRRASPPSEDEKFLYGQIEAGLPDDALETNEWFVACFSSERDDLSQWRAYGGGESGYSIGFASTELIKLGLLDHRLLVPVNYDRATHLLLVKAVAAATVQFFLDGLSAGRERCAWAQAFLMEWVNNITNLAPILKDPAFHAEKEWRLILRLRQEDIENMKYRQKRTMMSRHLPLAFPPPGQPASKLLPISEIMVGPSRHKEISRVSVADMLRTHAYPDDQRTVSVSCTPLQTT